MMGKNIATFLTMRTLERLLMIRRVRGNDVLRQHVLGHLLPTDITRDFGLFLLLLALVALGHVCVQCILGGKPLGAQAALQRADVHLVNVIVPESQYLQNPK